MKVRKDCFFSVLGGLLVLGLSDQPRRQVPDYWQMGLTPENTGRFVIRNDGDITLKLVSARLDAGNLEIVPVPFYQEGRPQTRSIADIARHFSTETKRPVLAAINGGFFDTRSGLPIGFLLRDRQMEFFNMPQGFQRSMVGFSTSREPSRRGVWVSSPKTMPKAWLDTVSAGAGRPLRSGTLAVHQINVPGGAHALTLFTPTYAATLRPPDRSLYVTACAEPGRRGVYRVCEAATTKRVRIPTQGLVVALHGDARAYAGRFPIGALVRPRWSLPEEWQTVGVTHGLLAGPRLLQRGKVDVTAKAERLEALKSRDRMALAVKPDGEILLVWAHKKTTGNLSFEELAHVLSKIGADDAIALDGGKSRAILAQTGPAPANERYYESGRPVANALVLAPIQRT